MRYLSTRGARRRALVFAEVLLAGLAPDGGLYLPAAWPQFSRHRNRWLRRRMPYQAVRFCHPVAFYRRTLFRDDDLKPISTPLMPAFEVRAIAPLGEIGNEPISAGIVSRSDLGLQGHRACRSWDGCSPAPGGRGGRATIVAATSGDTGSAAIAALGGLPNIDVFVLHPMGRVSEVQRRQMTTHGLRQCPQHRVGRKFRRRLAMVKGLFADTGLRRATSGLTAVNSINFVRIAAQCGLLLHRQR